MLKVTDIKTMREAEKACGIHEDILTQRAAAFVANYIFEHFAKVNIAIICGKGGNGRDGYIAAKLLLERGISVQTFTPPEFVSANGFDVVVDALFGSGLNRELQENDRRTVAHINSSDAYVISLDIPSGLHGDTGAVLGCAVKADLTIAFGAVKTGLLYARDYSGRIIQADIGISIKSDMFVPEEGDFLLNKRASKSHKGDYGRVKILGSSPQMIGAPLLSAVAALRAGAGLCTLCVPKSLALAYQKRVLENTLFFMPDTDGLIDYNTEALSGLISDADAIAVGMGMGRDNKNIKDIVKYLAFNFRGVLILDADALNSLIGDIVCLKNHICTLILTPHIGEFKRLTDYDAAAPHECAKRLSKTLDCITVLKSDTSIITDGQKVYFNTVGTPALAKGGSGDVLAGIIAAYSKRLPPLEACARACIVHGRAGMLASETRGENGVLASDITEYITD